MKITPTEARALLRRCSKAGTGKAVLLAVNVDEFVGPDAIMNTPFEENERTPNPMQACWNLKESIEGDWPKYEWTVVANDRARYLQWRRNLSGLFSENLDPEDYVETFR